MKYPRFEIDGNEMSQCTGQYAPRHSGGEMDDSSYSLTDIVDDLDEQAVTYEVVSNGTQKGFPKLVDSQGYSYTKKTYGRRSKTTYWICSRRCKNLRCRATVMERNSVFKAGSHLHCHPTEPGVEVRLEITTEAKKRAISDITKSAGEVVKELLTERLEAGCSPDILPKPHALMRRVLRARQGLPTPRSGNNFDFKDFQAKETSAFINNVEPIIFYMDDQEVVLNPQGEPIQNTQVLKSEAVCDENYSFSNKSTDLSEKVDFRSENCSFNSASTVMMPQQYEQYPMNDCTTFSANLLQEDLVWRREDITYDVLSNGTQKGHPRLVDSLGHTYTKKRSGKNGNIYWVCSVRSKAVTCSATVLQQGNKFTPGCHLHCHPSKSGRKVKTGGEKRKLPEKNGESKIHNFSSAKVQKVETDASQLESLDLSLMGYNMDQLWQGRQTLAHSDISFELEAEFIPSGFLQADICAHNARHILLFTQNQKGLLDKAKTLYLDKSLKTVMKPFEQIFAVHAYVKETRDAECKYVPLAFCLMSRRRRKDYKEVMKAISNTVPAVTKNVKMVVMNFEVAVWQAIREMYGDQVLLKGCVYYWTQAVWNKCEEYKLQVHYKTCKLVRELVHRLLALPFLPAESIENAFLDLQNMAAMKPILSRFFQYIETVWILGYWTPEDWSVYGCTLRSSSDVQGWHSRLNTKAGISLLSLLQLIMLLYRESETVNSQMKVAKKGKLILYQRQSHPQVDRLFTNWQKYEEGHLSAGSLLTACSRLRNTLW